MITLANFWTKIKTSGKISFTVGKALPILINNCALARPLVSIQSKASSLPLMRVKQTVHQYSRMECSNKISYQHCMNHYDRQLMGTLKITWWTRHSLWLIIASWNNNSHQLSLRIGLVKVTSTRIQSHRYKMEFKVQLIAVKVKVNLWECAEVWKCKIINVLMTSSRCQKHWLSRI